jgi:ribonuclease HI
MFGVTGRVVIHTDGACSGNPGPGGWGAVIRYGTEMRDLKGGEGRTTNNRMELLAAIKALESLDHRSAVDLYTDSEYLRNGISQWMAKWKTNGWRTYDKKQVKNVDLWQRLDQAAARHEVKWHWLRGHMGHAENERADELAREGMAPFLRR